MPSVLTIKVDKDAAKTPDSLKKVLLNAKGMAGVRLCEEDFSVRQLEDDEWEIIFVTYRREGISYIISKSEGIEIINQDAI